jgi:two-component sensor histidine kinase
MLLEAPPVTHSVGELPSDTAGTNDDVELRMLELRHRMKNILAIVQSLVNQTLRDGADIAEARQLLGSRLVAIGHSVDLLLGEDWRAAQLDRLVGSAITSGTGQVRIGGPEIAIGPSTAMMLGILFHELECNALKYGALSASGGTVSVSWWIEDEARLAISWSEADGPPVHAPQAAGFGSKLVARIAARFGGEAESDFRPEGLRWKLVLPLSALGN